MPEEEEDPATAAAKPTAPASAVPGDLNSIAPQLARSPLGIFALFILLVYAVAGIVCATWKPPVPEPLVWFIVCFPVLVFLVFTWLVVDHHLKLYGPGDFVDQRDWLAVQQSIADAAKAMDALQPVISRTDLPPEVNVLAKLDKVEQQIAQRTGVNLSRKPMAAPPQGQAYREWNEATAESPKTDKTVEPSSAGSAQQPAPVVRGVAALENQVVDKKEEPTEAMGEKPPVVPDDPQKGQWGGKREQGTYHVEVVGGRVTTLVRGIYRATLRVYSSDPKQKITRPVVLHLHDTFDPNVRKVAPVNGEVVFPMVLWGSFTVGVDINEPDPAGNLRRTKLEIDLADPDIVSDQAFKET